MRWCQQVFAWRRNKPRSQATFQISSDISPTGTSTADRTRTSPEEVAPARSQGQTRDMPPETCVTTSTSAPPHLPCQSISARSLAIFGVFDCLPTRLTPCCTARGHHRQLCRALVVSGRIRDGCISPPIHQETYHGSCTVATTSAGATSMASLGQTVTQVIGRR
jgi:hypothetical protein